MNMESAFDQLMKTYGIISEKNETALLTSTNLPGPGTEVSLVSNAASHPFIKSKGAEFQAKVKQYVADNKKKNRKYRLLISSVRNIRPSIEMVSGGGDSLGLVADVIENHGTHNMGSFTVPLEVLKIENAAWNQNGADIPDGWKYDDSRFNKFNEVVKGFSVRGEQPKSD